jgi:hypothetical protein
LVWIARDYGLKVQARRADRVNVFVDGEYAFSVQDILAAGLRLARS